MRLALPRTVGPLAGVSLLSVTDMIVVDVLDQIVHVAEIAYVASLPPTHGNLVVALAAVVVILAAAYQGQEGGRVGDVAGGI